MSPLPEPTYDRAPAPPRAPRKMWVAVLLALFFGPLGLFYVNATLAILMSIAVLAGGLFTVGVAAILLWPVCILAAVVGVLASREEER